MVCSLEHCRAKNQFMIWRNRKKAGAAAQPVGGKPPFR
jgi:hypothetical protein